MCSWSTPRRLRGPRTAGNAHTGISAGHRYEETIYIFSSGRLKRKENTLCLVKLDGEKKYIPVADVSSLVVLGEAVLNKRLLEFLTSKKITLHFFNRFGYYVGSYYPRVHYSSGYMTLRQCEHYLDPSKRLVSARKFVEGSIRNMMKNVAYYDNRKGGLGPALEFLERALTRLGDVSTVEEAMAIERLAKERYYTSFNAILSDPDYHYRGRERRPPKGRLNALLSFGNSLLYVTVLSEVYKTHLDPRIGYLHSANFRRFSLNLDVAEVFKPVIVDRLVFTLVNKRMLDRAHFMEELGGVYLNEQGRRLFVEQYENKLKQTIGYRRGARASYRRLIRIELYKLEKHLIGEKEYTPFIAPW